MSDVVDPRPYRQGFNDFTHPIARKQHQCVWCGEMIEAGTRHMKFVGEFEREFQSWRIHIECHRYSDKVFCEWPDMREHGINMGEYSRGLTDEGLVANKLAGVDPYWMPREDIDKF
jgi:hypothetical protein